MVVSTLIKRLIFLGCLLLWTSCRCWSQENPEKYKALFLETIEKINTQLKMRGITHAVVPTAKIIVTEHLDISRHIHIIEVSSNPEINIELLPSSLEIISLYRNTSLAQTKSYDTPPKPTWTKHRAIEQATDWYLKIIGKLPSGVGPPFAKWEPGLNPPKYYDGEWTVQWPRMDSHGHVFASDTISVDLNETDGVTYIANNFISQFVEGQKILVDRDEAIKLGKDAAEKMLLGPLAAPWANGLTLESRAASADLLVVNPNHILELKNIGDMASAGDTKARLAWVIKYRASNASGMGSYIYVWIDTETKAVLGGDFQ